MSRIRKYRPRRLRRRGGTAILEFAVSLPLLALVLTVTFFFGWAVMNQDHLWVSDRYACWRQVRNGSVASDLQINQKFFGGVAQNVITTRDRAGVGTEGRYVSYVASDNGAAGDLAQELVVRRFPKGQAVSIQATFPTTVRFWQQFTGAIFSRSARESVEWRWRQAKCGAVVADQDLQAVDGFLRNMPAPANSMGNFFRSLYREDEDGFYHDY